MDLLGEEKKKNSKTKWQKIILTLLIFSIILSVFIVILLVFLKSQGGNKIRTVEINGTKMSLEKLGIITTEEGTEYIALKTLCNNLNYEYKNGEFNIPGESKDKGHIVNGDNIVQFYENSTRIFKTQEKSTLDYEYLELEHNILFGNANLYIAITDLKVALNLIVYYSETDNNSIIQTPEYWIEKNTSVLEEKNLKISDEEKNYKALAYNYLIVENNSKFGVIKLNGEEIIGTKYNEITFCEYTGDFIVANINNKFGVIKDDGTTKIQLQYDSIEIIHYDPLLYKVEKTGNFGIVKDDGTTLNEIDYDSIGYSENQEKNRLNTLLIPQINENVPVSIVVCKDNLYGLLELETGKVLIPCELKGIFWEVDKNDNSKGSYNVEMIDARITTLEKYIQYINQITASINV